MEEVWRDIEGYEGIYLVSNFGRIKSLPRRTPGLNANKEIFLKQFEDKDGYYLVNLYKNGKAKLTRVSRIVAKTFIPNPNKYPEVNHKDENPKNNHTDNLEWCTKRYNLTYGHRLDCAKGENNSKHKLSKVQVEEIRRVYKKGDPEFGQSALGRKYGVAHGSIAAIVKRKSWK